MTVEEIFSKISAHMIRGMMFHEQMCNYYDFLGLRGYKRCHEYHYLCETLEHRKLQRFYINRYNRLIPGTEIESNSVIPSGWSRYTRQDVDRATKRDAVETGLTEWLRWERETRELYTEMYAELEKTGEIYAAEVVCRLICNADKEIKRAEREQLELEAVDYDLAYIGMKQHKMHDKYKQKLKEKAVYRE